MKIFDKRPLALILCIILGSFVIFYFLDTAFKILFLSLLVLLSVLSFAIKPSKYNTLFVKALLIISIISSALSLVYFECYFKAYQRYGEAVEIEAAVTEFQDTGYGYRIDLKATSINQDSLSSYLLKTDLSYDEATNISLGSHLKIRGKILPFLSPEGDNTYYLSLGYSGYVDEIEKIEITGYSENLAASFLRRIREIIKLRIMGSTDENVGGLITALFLGDKSELHGQISLDFSRIGISHLLALSGAHLSILILGFSKILLYLSVNKKLRSIITILATVLYVTLTGFSLSVMRAGLMLIICYVLYLSKYKPDSITSLFIAAFIIALIEPYALLSLSLWLSLLATFGILGYVELSRKNTASKSKLVKSTLISLFAVYATLLISNLSFDGLTYLSILTTLIFTPLIAVLLIIALPIVIFSSFDFLSAIANGVGKATIRLAAAISDLRFSFLSDDYIYLSVLIAIFTLLLIAFFVLSIKRKRAAVTVLTAFYVFIQISALALAIANDKKIALDYSASSESEFLILSDENESTLVLIDEPSYTAAREAKAELNSQKRTYLDNCVLISYSSKMESSILRLLDSFMINKLYIPMPQNDYELEKSNEILKSTEYYRAEIIFYDLSQVLKFGKSAFVLTSRPNYNESQNDGVFLFAVRDGKYYSYADISAFDGRYANNIEEILSVSESLIIGKYDAGEYRFNYKIPSLNSLIIASEAVRMGEDVYSFYQYRNIHFYPEKISLNK